MNKTIQLRTFSNDTDFLAMAAILTASEKADDQPRILAAEDLESLIRNTPGFDLQHDLIIAETAGQPVAFGRVRRPGNGSAQVYSLNGYISPAWRHESIGTMLLERLERRVAEIVVGEQGGGSVFLHLTPSLKQGWLHALACRAGYTLKESWVLMVRPNLENLLESRLPHGLEVRLVQPEQYDAIWQAVKEAYAPEGEPAPNDDIPGGIENDPNFQPELWQVAWDVSSGKVVGSVMTYINHSENEMMGIRRGYTEGISTIPAWQGKGVATALIARSLKVQRQAGMTESALVCSGEKEKNLQLYRKCGFQEVKRDTVYEKGLTLPAEGRHSL